MSEKLNILVVEDDDALRDALQSRSKPRATPQMPPMAGRRPWKP